MEDWRMVIVRFNLDRFYAFPDWLPILRQLPDRLISTPTQLSGISYGDIVRISDSFDMAGSIIHLRHGGLRRG